MPETPAKFYLTTPIYYVNARPHIGHAYSTIAADVIARRHRLLGEDTFFLTGTDEHGQKVQRSAEKAGIPPQQFADEVSATFRDLWARMGITNDDYIRTTDERHKRGVQKLWSELQSRDAIYLSSYTGQYSVGEEMFVEGPPGTIGPDGKPTETVTEENYFFRLSDYQERLIDLIHSNDLEIKPDAVRNEVLSFLTGNITFALDLSPDHLHVGEGVMTTEEFEAMDAPDIFELAKVEGFLGKTQYGTYYVPGALKDLSISRTTFSWGIPVPGDEKHVIYVWLDALANYMTAVGYGSDDPADIAKFNKYWPADLHLVGKEITRFHCVYWPAFLMAANLPLPKAVVANGWLLFEESKMSKSRGNVVRTETILDAFGPLCPPTRPPSSIDPSPVVLSEAQNQGIAPTQPQPPTKAEQDLFASDVIRYFLLREIPFGQDGSFSFDALITRYNADLANGYGNLVSRTLSMIQSNYAGSIPTPPSDPILREVFASTGERIEGTHSLIAGINLTTDTYTKLMTDCTLSAALSAPASMVTAVDRYISAHAPWKLAKSTDPVDRSKLSEVLYTAAEAIRRISILLYPFMPCATAKVWSQLGLDPAQLTTANQQLTTLTWGGLQPGTRLGPLAPIFPRADKGLAQIMTDMESANIPATPEPASHEASAGPRTSTLPLEDPGTTVAGSHALTTERPGTPSHTEAQASGVFAAQPAAETPPPATPQITIDDFVKIDLRVAQIVVAERIPKADKLLRLEVDLGYERRQILSGIAEWYTPEELIGRRIAVIANLAPRKMRGLESHGMLLAASDDSDPAVHGRPTLASFSDEIPLGSRIR